MIRRYRELELEEARYEALLAKRRYNAVLLAGCENLSVVAVKAFSNTAFLTRFFECINNRTDVLFGVKLGVTAKAGMIVVNNSNQVGLLPARSMIFRFDSNIRPVQPFPAKREKL